MKELEQLLGLVPKGLALVSGYPLWVKVGIVLAILVVGYVVLSAAQGEGGE